MSMPMVHSLGLMDEDDASHRPSKDKDNKALTRSAKKGKDKDSKALADKAQADTSAAASGLRDKEKEKKKQKDKEKDADSVPKERKRKAVEKSSKDEQSATMEQSDISKVLTGVLSKQTLYHRKRKISTLQEKNPEDAAPQEELHRVATSALMLTRSEVKTLSLQQLKASSTA